MADHSQPAPDWMTPAHVIADQICGCANRDQHRRDVALIEADRAAVRKAERDAIVAWLRTARALAGPGPYKSLDVPIRLSVIGNLIDAIERNDHLPPAPEQQP